MANLSVNLIKNLYYKEKLSVVEIGKKLRVNEWTIYRFMKKMNLSRRTFKEANAEKFNKKPITFSIKQNLSAKEEKLKIAGIMLYWAEGSKSNPVKKAWNIDFANSNPQMIKLFLKFLRKICGIDEKRLRVYLYYYINQNVKKLKRYWHKITKIPLAQFTKPYVRKDFLPEKIGKMKYGLAHIRYGDKRLLLQIEKWVKEYLEN